MSSLVFLDMTSQPCRAVYMFIKKNNLPIETKMISLLSGEHQTEEFAKVNPLKKVPALKDGDFCMGESIPIMEYLAEKYKTPDHWYPKDILKRARVNEYLSWQHLGIRNHGIKMVDLTFLAQEMYKLEVPEAKVASAREDLNSSLDVIEKNFIQEEGFIGGDQISIADLMAIVEVIQPYALGLDVFKNRPKLIAWKERVVKAVGKELFDDAHNIIMSTKETAKQIDPSQLEQFKPLILKLIS